MKYLFLLIPFFIYGDELEVCRRIENHLIIKDNANGIKEAEAAFHQHPESLAVIEGLLKAYARAGEERKMLWTFDYWKQRSTEKTPRRIYEEMCWGIIEKQERSGSPLIRTLTTLAAYWGQDARGVKIIERRLQDSNSLVKQAAASVASRMQDERIKRAIQERLPKENDWETRLQLILSVGTMKIKSMKPVLIDLIADSKSTMEEKQAASEALLTLLEDMPLKELLSLACSDRVGLRALAAEAITYLGDRNSIDVLWKLSNDERSEVRAQAILGLGVLRVPMDSRLVNLLSDREFHVRLGAAYAILLTGSNAADLWIIESLMNEKAEYARLVAAMLGAGGAYGSDLAKNILSGSYGEVKDFFTKINLALAVLDPPSLNLLYEGITENKERWTKERKGVFHVITLSHERHRPLFPNYPEMVNKETRLEILNLLAIKEHPKALSAVREFLTDKGWGISGITSALLLSEGEEGEVELIRPLLNDSDPDIRLQAALILVRWDPEEVPIKILTENYASLSREKKEIVLQALGAIGDEEAIGFLVKEMGSPYASMRLIASASLIKCLYE